MAEDRSDPLTDLFTLFAAPLSGTVRSLEQFRKGVDEFLRGVENFNRTMENLNQTSERINNLLADVEEPIRAAIPQVTRTVKAADDMMQVVSGPAMAVAPGLNKLADTLNTPGFAQLPNQIGQFSDLLGEVSRRLGPLAQFAESAGGLFGGFRMPGMRPTGTDTRHTSTATEHVVFHAPTDDDEHGVTEATASTAEPARATASATKQTATTGRSSASQPAAKKSTAKKSTARKSAARKSTTKRSGTKKSAKKRTSKKQASKKRAAVTSLPTPGTGGETSSS